MTDHESNEGLSFAIVIGIAGVIVAAALVTVLSAVRLLVAMKTRIGEFNGVLDGVGGLP